MRTLSYESDEHTGFVHETVKLTTRKGKEFWLGNPMSEISEAIEAGEPFVAHYLKGMRPHELIVNPADVSTVEAFNP